MRILIDLQSKQNGSRYRGIGRYSLALTKAIARNAGGHQIFVLLSSLFPDTLDEVRRSLSDSIPAEHIFVMSAQGPVGHLNSQNSWRVRAAEIMREQLINELTPDALLITSLIEGSLDDTISSIGLITSEVPVAVVLYDLIPFLDPDKYIGWPPASKWYYEKIESLKRADLLLAISESASKEAIDFLGVNENRIVTISSAADETFIPSTLARSSHVGLLNNLNITRKFLMYTSAYETRKNFERLIKAFSKIPVNLRKEYQLVLVSKLDDQVKESLKNLASTSQLKIDEVVLAGFIPDEDLISLYSLCHLFVFPSIHEGFGLPALEAMSCGAAVIGSNTSSIPEVIGRADALFDPYSTESMCEVICRALSDDEFLLSLKQHSLSQAKKFNWNKTALTTIAALEKLNANNSITDFSVNKSEKNLSNAIEQISKIKSEVPPTENDLVGTAQSMCTNELAISRFKAMATFAGQLTWRIEGPFDSTYSLALLNRETARALNELGHRVVLHSTEGPGDFPPNPVFLQLNPDLAEMNRRVADSSAGSTDITSRNLYPPRVSGMSSPVNLLHHYAWEETGFPQDWVSNFNTHLNGITCLSDHVKKIMIDNGVTVPLVTSGCGVDHWDRIHASTKFEIAAKKFRFLHVSSCFPRKGADALLDAYGQAFCTRDDVSLVIKTFPNPHNEIHVWLAERQSKNTDFPHVVIIEDDLSDSDLKALYQLCDVLVAPSRAEGFGLPMAEAMLSGLPVITTGWSGQLDFCSERTGWLVDYVFAPAQTHFGLFFSAWAQPDIEDLSKKLKIAYNSTRTQRNLMADAGQVLLRAEHKWVDCVGRAVNAALSWRSSKVKPTVPKIGWVTTWNTKCGIATYSEHLISNMSCDVTILAACQEEALGVDDKNCYRSWFTGKDKNNLQQVDSLILHKSLNTIVIQFNYAFFDFSELAQFIDKQLMQGRVVVLMMHSTSDPFAAPNWQLSELKNVFARCHRILVHSIPDLNRLKSIGLVDNVCLFPHAILNYEPIEQKVPTNANSDEPLIAAYGFCLPHKGLKELIEAVALLKQEGMRVRLRLVNAEYPDDVSTNLVNELKKHITTSSLDDLVEFYSEFLEDKDSLALLSEADILVFPYQVTGESSSAAVRYGLATKRPVAVTPLGIFDDLGDSVFRFSSTSPGDIAQGIKKFLEDIRSNSQHAQKTVAVANRWRDAHNCIAAADRLKNICTALLKENEEAPKVLWGSDWRLKTDVGSIQGKSVFSTSSAGCLIHGPFQALSAGRYEIRVYGDMKNSGTPSAHLEIAVKKGTEILFSRALTDPSGSGLLTNTKIYLKDAVNDLVVRVLVTENSNLNINKVEIVPETLLVESAVSASRICTQKELESGRFQRRAAVLREPHMGLHRKLWEWCFIAEILDHEGMLVAGKKGLGFAVGREPLVAHFASHGVDILASDLDMDRASKAGWVGSNEHAASLGMLNNRGLCDETEFARLVRFQEVNMLDFAFDQLRGFDFLWSSCAFEHLGSLVAGHQFVIESMKCLRPGGLAVHTTEFNAGSNDATVSEGATVIYRKKDIEALASDLRSKGHLISLNFDSGNLPADYHIDIPPYTHDTHLKLRLQQHTTTSIGIVVRCVASSEFEINIHVHEGSDLPQAQHS
jgi:O-antigen biosynthesis alpha-1,2-mannosyltransferase